MVIKATGTQAMLKLQSHMLKPQSHMLKLQSHILKPQYSMLNHTAILKLAMLPHTLKHQSLIKLPLLTLNHLHIQQ